MADYKEKIRKLLALAESPNENEAKAALLRAKQLMAEYKLSEADLEESKAKAVKEVMTDITCSKRRHPWIVTLAGVIGENYCCQGFRQHTHNKQTQRIGFVGFEDDVELCITIFKYAVDCILSNCKMIENEYSFYNPSYGKAMSDSYGMGFVSGINEAFQKQQEEHPEWGLILVKQKEIDEATAGFTNKPFTTSNGIIRDGYRDGYEDGKKFDPTTKLKEGEAV